MVRTFEQIVKDVFSLPNTDEEVERLLDELELIEKRDWRDYITLAVNIITEVDEKVKFCFTGFSVKDSLFVLKAIGDKYIPKNFVKKKHPKDILFHDALRLNIEIVYAENKELTYLYRLTNFIIGEYCKRSRLYLRTRPFYKRGQFDKRIYVVSKKRNVPDEDLHVISNERSDGPREEIDILHKYFLIYVSCKLGI